MTSRLACDVQGAEMLQEIAAVSPHEYERQQKDDLASSGGVRNVAKFVESLAERCCQYVSHMCHVPESCAFTYCLCIHVAGVSVQPGLRTASCTAGFTKGRLLAP